MITRPEYLKRIKNALDRNAVAMLLGARQIGKSTLAQQLLPRTDPQYFDLELPSAQRLMTDPYTTLEGLRGLVVIDEAQRAPALFPVLRVLADRPRKPARFLLLGSASPELSRQSNESLAGRVEFIDVFGFTSGEAGRAAERKLWLRGGFPRSFLARNDQDSMLWRDQFIRSFLERDLRALGFDHSPAAMGRFWTMIAHYHGQIWNAAEVAGSLKLNVRTVNRYLEALEQTFMIRRVLPWYENLGKRIVKSPKIYFRDSGLFHSLMRIGGIRELMHHPKYGASWEGFVVEEIAAALKLRDFYFFNVHSGSELDMFFLHSGKRVGVEIKREDAPRMTKSMHVALEDLRLDKLRVVYPGTHRYKLAPKVECVPFAQLHDLLK